MSQSTKTNRAVVLHAPLKAAVHDNYPPVPSLSSFPSDHILLQIAYTGVCGSDVHFYLHGGVGSDARKYVQYYNSQFQEDGGNEVTPSGEAWSNIQQEDKARGLIMGHEATAVITEVGSSVKSLKVGDQVAIEPGIPCRQCPSCADGKYNFCPDMRFAASFHVEDGDLVGNTPGTLSKYYVLPECLCYKLPEHVSLQDGILIEPLAVAMHAARLAKISASTESVVVMGAGTIGLCCAATSIALGARKVVLVDINSAKLGFAASWFGGPDGATPRSDGEVLTFQTDISKTAEENAVQLKQQRNLPMAGVDVVLEGSGAASSTSTGIFLLRQDGNMVQTGLSKKPLINDFPIVELSEKEIHLHGAFRYNSGDFAGARNLLERGLIQNLGKLISNVFPFDDFELAWQATRDGKGIKNIIQGVQVDFTDH